MSTFLVELQDHVRVFNRELLVLERGATGEAAEAAVKTLFRTVHSLKGAARSVEAKELARSCHALEELLTQMRDGTRRLTPELFALMFQAVDAFDAAGRNMGSAAPTGASDAALIALTAQLGVERNRTPPVVPVAVTPLEVPGAARTPDSAAAPSQPSDAKLTPPPSVMLSIPKAPSFSQMPFITDVQSSLPPARTMAPSEEHAVVRIPVRRLDALLTQCGEQVIARRRLAVRCDEVNSLYEHVVQLRASFRTLYKQQKVERERAAVQANGGGVQVLDSRAAVSSKSQRVLEQNEASLERVETGLERLTRALEDDVRNLERASAPLEAQVHRVRLLPFAEACQGLHRTVRDLAHAQNKNVDFTVHGGDVELDRAVIESARVALMHLVQNAVDHGIETAADREQRGKVARASLNVSAVQSGDRVEITVTDDGRGLDIAALREQAIRRGMKADDETELARLIFAAGVSTAATVSEVSGRGVGLDVVRSLVEELRGEVEVTSQPGLGTRFLLQLPTTTGTLRALLVEVGSQIFALPTHNIQALLRATADELSHMEGREVLLTPAGPVPLGTLRGVLGMSGDEPARPDGKLPIVVLTADARRIALVVENWQSEQELLQKPLGKRVRQLRQVAAAAFLPSGEIALLLRPHELVRSVLSETSRSAVAHVLQEERVVTRKRVLLVDDSVTTRTLERSILEAAGYEVLTAADGEQGFRLLQEHSVDVVVSDVEMPNMDGFQLTQTIRGTPRFRGLPVVLLTSLATDGDRARGLSAGADAYLVKTAFDQDNLIETLRQLT